MMRTQRAVAAFCVVGASCGLAALAVPARDGWRAAQAREMHLADLERAARQTPFDGRMQALLGARRIQAGHFGAAARSLKQSAAAGEDTVAVRLTWAACLAAARRRRDAEGVLRSGSQQKPLGDALGRLAALDPNAPSTDQAVAIAPESVNLLLDGYARPNGFSRFVTSGLETEAARYTRSAKDRDATLRWCGVLNKNERYAEARHLIEPFRQRAPLDNEVCLTYADALRGLRLPRKAGLEYIPVVQRDHGSLRALLGVGSIALDAGIVPVSVDAFTRATRLSPNSSDAWIGLGRAYLKQGVSYAKALSAFEKAASLAPDRTDHLVSYNHALRMVFRWPEAEAVLRRRLTDAPEDAEAMHFLAITLLDGRRTPDTEREAETLLKTSLDLEPDAVTTAARLAQLLVAQDRFEEAVPHLEMVLSRNRYDLASAQAIARAYRKLGRKEDAEAARQSALELSEYLARRSYLNDRLRVEPTSIALHTRLADLLDEGGETEVARRHRQMAADLKRDPRQAARDIYMLGRSTAQGIQVPHDETPETSRDKAK